MDEQQNYALLSKLYIYPGKCIHILFTKLPCPGDNEQIFRSSSQAAPAHLSTTFYHTVRFMVNAK